jgi:hypothetical protein
MAEHIDDILSGFDQLGGLNYVVSLGIWRTPGNPDWSPADYVVNALGNAGVAQIVPTSGAEMLATVEQCLRHAGDGGSHPDRAFLRSVRFKELLAGLRAYLEAAIADASVWMFSLFRGHPFYPVMWDFAYLIVRSDGAEVFIGSSSD